MSKLSKIELYSLWQLAYRLLALEPSIDETTAQRSAWVRPFQGVLGITDVCLFDAATDKFFSTTAPGSEWENQTRATYVTGESQDDSASRIAIRPLAAAGQTVGAVAFQGLENPSTTAEPLSALAVALLQQMRGRHQHTAAAVEAEIAAFRFAILDVLSGECKNSLTTILAATGGLLEAGRLSAAQLEMAQMVEEEASRLGGIVSRLDWIARLDESDVVPRLDSTDVAALTAQTVDQWARFSPDRQIVFARGGTPAMALADPDLLRLALIQLLDNACKFSAHNAAVQVDVSTLHGSAVIGVSSEGQPIPAPERERIFDRAYPGSRTSQFTLGSGLGLYAARKIALAHGGTLDLDPEKMWTSCVAFRLSLPLAIHAPEE